MKRQLKNTCMYFLAALAAAGLLTFSMQAYRLQQSFNADLYGSVIRLHILANSGSPEDQQLKLALRDKTLEYLSLGTGKAETAEEAAGWIEAHLEDISEYVCDAARQLGYDGSVRVDFGCERYPVRRYEQFTFPAGTYRSLRISLGKAQGKNWWCVLYPAICTGAVSDTEGQLVSAGVSDKSAEAICSQDTSVQVSFYFLELFQNLRNP